MQENVRIYLPFPLLGSLTLNIQQALNSSRNVTILNKTILSEANFTEQMTRSYVSTE